MLVMVVRMVTMIVVWWYDGDEYHVFSGAYVF